MIKLKRYQVLAFNDENSIYVSKLNELYLYSIQEKKLKLIKKFRSDKYTMVSKLSLKIRRLLRKDIRYAFKLNDEILLLIKNKRIIRFNIPSNEIESDVGLPRGSRPLNIIEINSLKNFTNGIYFGEYFSNPLKKSVHIYRYSKNGLESVFEFPEGQINHIHNLIEDKLRNCIWILAGDFDDSAAIYKATDNFINVECVVRGKQEFRSCVAFSTKEGLIYATDSQFEQNSIRLLFENNREWTTKKLFDMNGPSIYGTKIDEDFIFSTSVEAINSGNIISKYLRNQRGPGIIKNQSEIVSGNIQNGFKTIYSNKKDRYPFILFQFGNILFPSGENKTNQLIFTNIALKKNDYTTMIIPFKKNNNKNNFFNNETIS